MKYIHIVQFHLMSGGGVGSVLTDLCEAMSKESDETYIISLFRRKGIDFAEEQRWAAPKGIHVMLMQQKESDSFLKVIWNLRRTLKELAHEDECCLFMHLKMGVLVGIVSSLGMKNVKRVEVYHSGYMNYKLQSFVSRPFIQRYISVSKEAKQQLIEWFHIKQDKIDVVYNGVDVEQIRKIAGTDRANSGLIHFMSVGRLSFEKGFKTPIQAYAELREGGRLKGSSFTMIGTGAQQEECKTLSKNYVNFTGVIPRENVYRSIGSCDVMILPSLWEGNSILMLEVLAIGKPMIVTDIPSFREVLGFLPLKDNEICRKEWFGAVFRKENVEACKKAMCLVYENLNIIADSAKRIRALGDEFSTREQAKEYIRIANES